MIFYIQNGYKIFRDSDNLSDNWCDVFYFDGITIEKYDLSFDLVYVGY